MLAVNLINVIMTTLPLTHALTLAVLSLSLSLTHTDEGVHARDHP